MADANDPDDDNDGVTDGADAFPFDAAETVDTDSDGNGEPDASDLFPIDKTEATDNDADGTGDNAEFSLSTLAKQLIPIWMVLAIFQYSLRIFMPPQAVRFGGSNQSLVIRRGSRSFGCTTIRRVTWVNTRRP